MALSPFHPKLMQFIYELTKQDKYYSDRELAKRIELRYGEKITAKTIRRWFTYLQQFCFDYYPHIEVGALGVQYVRIVCDYSAHMISRFPYQVYVSVLSQLGDRKKVLVLDYYVPYSVLDEFKEQLHTFKEEMQLEKLEIYFLRSPFVIHNDLGRCIVEDGSMKILHGDSELQNTLHTLDEQIAWWEKPLPKLASKDFFLVPVVFEYAREHWTSGTVWQQIIEKGGKNIWKIMKKTKTRTDHVGIKRVQQAIQQITALDISRQMKVIYRSLEKNRMYIWLRIASSNPKHLKDFCAVMLKYSVNMKIYKGETDWHVILLTGKMGIEQLMNIDIPHITPLYMENLQEVDTFWHRDLVKFKYNELIDFDKKQWKDQLEVVSEKEK